MIDDTTFLKHYQPSGQGYRTGLLFVILVFMFNTARGQYATPNLSNSAYTTGPYASSSQQLVGQCTWYVYGRIQETGLISAQQLNSLKNRNGGTGIFTGNAPTWYDDAVAAGLSTGTQPKPGAIAVWTNGVGHVAFVESVNPDGSFLVTESNSTPTIGYDVVIGSSVVNGVNDAYLRSNHSTSSTPALWQMPRFTVMHVIGGPVSQDGYQWYQLQGNGYTGWCAWLQADLSGPAQSTSYWWNYTRIQLSPASHFGPSAPYAFIYLSSSNSDLITQGLGVSPNSGTAGSSAAVSFTIKNQGSANAGTSTTNIRITTSNSTVTTSDPLLASISTPSISSGGTYAVNQSVTIPSSLSAGTYYIWVILDVNNTAGQGSANQGNDKSYIAFTVTVPQTYSDLITQGLGVSPNSGTAGSSAAVSFTIKNQGSANAGTSTTNIRITTSNSTVTTSDPLLASISTPSISSGGTYAVNQSVTIPSSLSAGTYYIWVILDVNNTAGQGSANQGNDKSYVAFTVKGNGNSNPPTSQIADSLESFASQYNIPAVVIAAVMSKESPNWLQFDVNGQPVTGPTGDVGLMQINIHNPSIPMDTQLVKADWSYNLQIGLEILHKKFSSWAVNTASPYDSQLDTDPGIIENWYYPVAWYNGSGAQAYNYVATVWGYLSSPPTPMSNYFLGVPSPGSPQYLSGFPATIYIAVPYPSEPSSWWAAASPSDLITHGVYTLLILADNAQKVHRWQWASNSVVDITDSVLAASAPQSVVSNITLSSGWSMISSNLIPTRTALDSVFGGIKSNLVIAKDGMGNVYWPSLGVNGIGSWDYHRGYKLYMSSADTLSITGTEVQPELCPINLVNGWNLISYLRDSAMTGSSALAGIGDTLVIAKDGMGNVYWPALNINTMGSMKPGQGYQLYVNGSCTLVYPSNSVASSAMPLSAAKSVLKEQASVPSHYKAAYVNTGSNATLLVKAGGLSTGDEIGVWDGEKDLIGSGTVTQGQALITIWGDNQMTKDIREGATENDNLKLTLWSKAGQQETPLSITSLTDGLIGQAMENTLKYKTDGVMIAQVEKVEIPKEYVLEQNYPNPFNPTTTIKYGLPKAGKVTMEVYDVIGQRVKVLVDGEEGAGYHEVVFDAGSLASGVYFYRLSTQFFTDINKMMLIK